jgi:hypothetical protein
VRHYICLVAACLALTAAGCGPRSAEIDPALARLVPSDTLALLDVKADALRATPLYRKYVAGRLESMKVTDDVSEALAVTNGNDVVVFTKGKSGIAQYDRQGNRTAPAARAGGVPPALRERLRSIAPRNQIFGAGIGGSLPMADALPSQGNLANLQNLLKALESWTLAADLRSGVKLETEAVYKTEQDAKQIHDALRGLLGIARLSTPADAPELLRMYDAVKVSMQKSTVAVSADVPGEALEKAVERVQRVPGP